MFVLGFSAGAVVTLVICLVFFCYAMDNLSSWAGCSGTRCESEEQRMATNRPIGTGEFM
jgi:multisubunit Na+/H+ antiporter MnhB subunit